ncbi:MAG: Bacterial type and secretion system protein [Phycisphaerales bacterium]|nr:Bacterial type and secretion system protein [Phycisphaerales bacterium]
MLRPVSTRRKRQIGAVFNVSLVLVAIALSAAATARLHSHRMPAADPLDRKVSEVRFNDVTFEAALDYFRNLSSLEFRVDWDAIEASGTHDTSTVSVHLRDVTLRDALEQFLSRTNHDLAFEVDGKVVRITTQSAMPHVVKAYDVSDLLPPPTRLAPPVTQPVMLLGMQTRAGTNALAGGAPAPRAEALEEIARLVADTVSPETWASNGGAGSAIWCGADRLIVLHTREGHRKIAALLCRLHEADALQAWKKPTAPAAQPD